MASKSLLVFALLLTATILVASANEQTQAKKEEESKQVYDGHHGGGYPGHGGRGGGGGYPGRGGRGGYCRFGCCRQGFSGGCRCCINADEIPEPMYRPEVVEVHN